MTETLKKLGYTVLLAKNGEEAIGYCYKSIGRNIDLLITDVVMPGMDGLSLADRFVENCSCKKVLFISGYFENDLVQERIIKGGMPFLRKPFTPSELARKVREVLDSG